MSPAKFEQDEANRQRLNEVFGEGGWTIELARKSLYTHGDALWLFSRDCGRWFFSREDGRSPISATISAPYYSDALRIFAELLAPEKTS